MRITKTLEKLKQRFCSTSFRKLATKRITKFAKCIVAKEVNSFLEDEIKDINAMCIQCDELKCQNKINRRKISRINQTAKFVVAGMFEWRSIVNDLLYKGC